MRTKGASGVSTFAINFDVANNVDQALMESGILEPAKVRRVTIPGVVDAAASRLVLPEKIVKQLGLLESGKVKVRYADGRNATRKAAEQVYVEILGRHGVFTAIIEPKRKAALIGAIV